MADKLVMGYWDCKYCGSKGIEGTKRECPHCGRPRGEGVKFYLGSDKRYLTKEESKNKGKGEDWFCEFCETLNSATVSVCESCGAPRETDSKTYSTMKNESRESSGEVETPEEEEAGTGNSFIQDLPNHENNVLGNIALALVLPLLMLCLMSVINLAKPKTATFLINSVNWQTTQDVEEYKTVHESDWHVPKGGRVTQKATELFGYNTVVDHYKTVTKSRQERVLDHYETKYSYHNNGDGTFIEKSHQEPVYRTETKYYTEQEPVYRQDPIYKTKYYYDIDKWVVTDTLVLRGNKGLDQFRFAKVEVTDKKRAGAKGTKYTCSATFTDGKKEGEKQTFILDDEIYKKLAKDAKVKCKYSGGRILEVLE